MNHLVPLLLTPQDGVEAASIGSFLDGARGRLGGEAAGWTTVDRAVGAGALARCVGHAFVAGYTEALRSLVPGVSEVAALCATEEGGGHPKAILTRVEEQEDGSVVVRGTKRWATAAGAASRLLVVGSRGVDERGRNRLVVVVVRASQAGVRLVEMPPPPFTPEIPHFEVHLEGARAEEVLPGDGYERYLKPFRTLEDLHVTGALLGYTLAEATRWRLGDDLRVELLSLLAGVRALAGDPSSVVSHLALAGVFAQLRGVLGRLEEPWARADAEGFGRWQRDRMLLGVAGKARAARTEAAWRAVPGHSLASVPAGGAC